jgi:methylated-DNA-[protein]-cysteine S-methyltransferase
MKAWTIQTPVAPWSVVVDGDTVVASGFCGLDDLLAEARSRSVVTGDPERADALGPVADAVAAYLAGHADTLDRVAVRQPGGEFQQSAWAAMRQIPSGLTWSYAELATKAGRPSAVRAAGTACARNFVAPFVPCHRVVRSDGSLGGYAYGLPVKRWLLDLEAS